MNLYLEKVLEFLYDRSVARSHGTDNKDCPTRDDIEHVLIIVKQKNNAELEELLGFNH